MTRTIPTTNPNPEGNPVNLNPRMTPRTTMLLLVAAMVLLIVLGGLAIAASPRMAGATTKPQGICWVSPSGDLYGPNDAEDITVGATRVPCTNEPICRFEVSKVPGGFEVIEYPPGDRTFTVTGVIVPCP